MLSRLIFTTTLFVFFLLPLSAFCADYTEDAASIEFVRIKGGTFLMGDPTGEASEALPTREVTVNDFYMGKYEVTFAQYDKFCRDTKRPLPSDNGWGRNYRPVINVTWDDAVAFTEWLSSKSSRTFRLPTEAEWEYAVTRGTDSFFPWGDNVGVGNANCRGCGSQWDAKSTSPVGSFPPSPAGLYDIVGNVYEWCLDSYHPSYDDAPTDGSTFEGGDHEWKINRGGSWYQSPEELSAYRRCWYRRDKMRHEYGFRVVLEP